MKKLGVAILFVATVALIGGSRLLRLYNRGAIHTTKPLDLYLYRRARLPQLSNLLVDSLHVVQSRQELKWAGHLLGWRKFQPGHYKINKNFSYDHFLSKLAKGNQDPVSVTIPPGQFRKEIYAAVIKNMRFDSTSFYNAIEDSTFLGSKNLTSRAIVGRLFPDTYEWYWTSSPKKVITDMLDQFNHRVVPLYHNATIDLNLPAVVVLASIVEGEALHDEEKPKISGLYWNRLKKNMNLQADPTVIYAIGKSRRLYLKDYKVKSPYNTYIHKGLPPGPINNPSLSSVKAVLHPQQNDYLYMVAKPNGYHAFSVTFAKHQRQTKKWRKYLQQQSKKKTSEPDGTPN